MQDDYWMCAYCRSVNEGSTKSTDQKCSTCPGSLPLQTPGPTWLTKKDMLTANEADAILVLMGSTLPAGLPLPLIRIIIEYCGVFRITPGMIVDALDPAGGSWRQAVVLQVRGWDCLVHWIGWTCVWDDWLPLGDLEHFEVCGARSLPNQLHSGAPLQVWTVFARHVQSFSVHNIRDDRQARTMLRQYVLDAADPTTIAPQLWNSFSKLGCD